MAIMRKKANDNFLSIKFFAAPVENILPDKKLCKPKQPAYLLICGLLQQTLPVIFYLIN